MPYKKSIKMFYWVKGTPTAFLVARLMTVSKLFSISKAKMVSFT